MKYIDVIGNIDDTSRTSKGEDNSAIEIIVTDIQSGINRKNELFAAIYKWLYKLCFKYLRFASDLGYELNDLLSVAWLGAEKAIKAFDSDKDYKFITYLTYHVKNALHDFLGIRNGKKLQHNISLDEEIPGAEDLTYGETIEDENAIIAFEKVEKIDFYDVLHNALNKLPEENQNAIKDYFWCDKREVDKQNRRKGIELLKRNKWLKAYYCEEYAYKHRGIATFNSTWTSSTEWAALKIMEL